MESGNFSLLSMLLAVGFLTNTLSETQFPCKSWRSTGRLDREVLGQVESLTLCFHCSLPTALGACPSTQRPPAVIPPQLPATLPARPGRLLPVQRAGAAGCGWVSTDPQGLVHWAGSELPVGSVARFAGGCLPLPCRVCGFP